MNDLSLHILDIIQNSLSAGATLIRLLVWEDVPEDRLTIAIGDNGKGMTRQQVERITDPFFTSRTTRRVGMGLPLYKQSAQQSGGDVVVESTPGEGTTVKATFGYANIDRPPLGDVANAVMLMVSANPHIDFIFTYRWGPDGQYVFDTREVKEVLDGMPLNDVQVMRMLTDMISANIDEVKNS